MEHDLNCPIHTGRDCACSKAVGKSVVLFSGGLDSTVCVAREKEDGREVIALFIDHGQANLQGELDAAHAVAELLGVELVAMRIDLSQVNSGGLLQPGTFEVKGSAFVPHRNLLMLALGAMLANDRGADRLIIGSTILTADYPDATRLFLAKAREALEEGSNDAILVPKIIAPLGGMTKAVIWLEAMRLGIMDAAMLTYTCYSGERRQHPWGLGCGECESCSVRRTGYTLAQQWEGTPA